MRITIHNNSNNIKNNIIADGEGETSLSYIMVTSDNHGRRDDDDNTTTTNNNNSNNNYDYDDEHFKDDLTFY